MSFARTCQREGPVPTSTRLYQAVGAWPDTFKNFAFNTFLLFYYSQVLGLPASLASVALAIALVFDAITDPLIGSLSDNLRSPLGRRHPLMYGAALPLGLFLYLTFSPPANLAPTGLFTWLLVMTVMTRVTLTFYLVPWNAMFAEFTDNYAERTSILTWRWAVGWTGGIAFNFVCWSLIFGATDEYEYGQSNPEAYGLFAPVLAIAVTASVLFTTHMTRRDIPYMYQSTRTDGGAVSSMRPIRELLLALKNRNFLRLFGAIFVGAIIAGTNGAMDLYMNTFFWGLRGEDLRWFVISIVGAVGAFILVGPLQKRFDKRTILLAVLILNLVNGMAFVSLRFADILPANGETSLLVIMIINATFRAFNGTMAGIIFGSMLADLVDEQDLDTGRRQEGVFSAAISFSAKLTGGVGIVVGGFLLDYVIRFPRAAEPGMVPADTVFILGLADGIIVPLFNVLPLALIAGYSLTRSRFAEVRTALDARRYTSNPGSSQTAP